MFSSFTFPGKDTRLVRCGSTVYKITVQSHGDPHWFQGEHLLCDDDTIQKELNIAVDIVVAMTRRSKLHQFRTDHLVFMPKRKPWKASTLITFQQYSKRLNAHPYTLVLTVDSCKRHQQGELQSLSKIRKRPPGKYPFAQPASKSFKVSSSKVASCAGISTPTTKSVSSSVTSSAASRKRYLTFDHRVIKLMKEYVQTPNQGSSQTFSPEEAQRILSNIALQLRPQSARQQDATMPFSLLHGKGVQSCALQRNSKDDEPTTSSCHSKSSPANRCYKENRHHKLRKEGHGMTNYSDEYDDADHFYRPSNQNTWQTSCGKRGFCCFCWFQSGWWVQGTYHTIQNQTAAALISGSPRD